MGEAWLTRQIGRGDMANALYALNVVVRIRGADGRERTMPVTEFHHLPGDTPQQQTGMTAVRLSKGGI